MAERGCLYGLAEMLVFCLLVVYPTIGSVMAAVILIVVVADQKRLRRKPDPSLQKASSPATPLSELGQFVFVVGVAALVLGTTSGFFALAVSHCSDEVLKGIALVLPTASAATGLITATIGSVDRNHRLQVLGLYQFLAFIPYAIAFFAAQFQVQGCGLNG